GSWDVYLIKTNSNGDNLWTKTFGGSEADIGNSVQQTFDGGYIIAGQTDSYGAGGFDVYLIKTNLNGDTLWTKTFGGYDWDVGYSVQQTFDRGYIIAGKTESFSAGGYDAYLIKTDSLGDTLWTRTYGGLDVEEGRSVQVTSDAGCIIAGHTGSFGAGSWDVYLIRLAGIVDTISPDSFNLISPLDSSILSITKPCFVWEASSDSNGIKNYEVYIGETLRVSLSDTTWTADYDLSEGFHNWYVVAYDMFDNSKQSNQIWAVGIDTTPPSIDSTTQWQDTSYAGPFEIRTKVTDNFAGLDLVLLYYKRDEDSNWLTEVMHSSGDWFTDTIPTVSLPNDTVRYYIRAIDRADPENESTDPAGAPSNFYSFISNLVGVKETYKRAAKFSLTVNTLVKGKAYIRFFIPEKNRISLKIYDITGRVISIPLFGAYSPGSHEFLFEPKRNGIYFYKFKSTYKNSKGKIIIF
ncbi:T9SS type A sorting domain-containing protein, partial [Candidatus Babeliales bacterium]|nr:T9SS type A sorting domain-containing protein [Candidatus Babeliales bacterium]